MKSLFLVAIASLLIATSCSHRPDPVAKSKTTGALGLDETFGSGGIARSVGAGEMQPIGAQLFVSPSDGSIHALAKVGNSLFFLSFGANGEPPAAPSNIYIPALENYGFDRDGKVIAVSDITTETTTLTRYTNAGAIDTTFGNAGQATVGFAVQALDFPKEGSTILLAGENLSSPRDLVVGRLKNDGSIDTTFGTAGRITLGASGWTNQLRNFLVQSDGKFLVAGNRLSRYLADGAPDTSFVGIPLSRDTGFYSNSGNALLSLQERAGQPYFYDDASGNAVSFLADGSRQDKQFQFSGAGVQYATLLLASSGKITLGGTCQDPDDWSGESDFCIFRANDSGGIDSDFGRDGGIYVAASPTGYDRLLTLAEQPDGKILAFGVSQSLPATQVVGTEWNFALVRIK